VTTTLEPPSPTNPPSPPGEGRGPGQVSRGLYKYGQGYWVRVMTAVMASALVLATAGWVFKSLSAVNLPTPTWSLQLEGYRGAQPSAGQVVELLAAPEAGGGPADVQGSASVVSYEPITPTTGLLRIGSITMAEKVPDPGDAGMVRLLSGPGAPPESASTARVVAATGVPVFQLLYLQAGVASLMLLLGTALVYWYAGRKPGAVDFLIATDGEMKKVNWSTRKEIVGSTWVVIAASVLIAAFLFAADFAFSEVMYQVGVIER